MASRRSSASWVRPGGLILPGIRERPWGKMRSCQPHPLERALEQTTGQGNQRPGVCLPREGARSRSTCVGRMDQSILRTYPCSGRQVEHVAARVPATGPRGWGASGGTRSPKRGRPLCPRESHRTRVFMENPPRRACASALSAQVIVATVLALPWGQHIAPAFQTALAIIATA